MRSRWEGSRARGRRGPDPANRAPATSSSSRRRVRLINPRPQTQRGLHGTRSKEASRSQCSSAARRRTCHVRHVPRRQCCADHLEERCFPTRAQEPTSRGAMPPRTRALMRPRRRRARRCGRGRARGIRSWRLPRETRSRHARSHRTTRSSSASEVSLLRADRDVLIHATRQSRCCRRW